MASISGVGVAAAPWMKTLVRLQIDATASEGATAPLRAEVQNDDGFRMKVSWESLMESDSVPFSAALGQLIDCQNIRINCH